METYTWANAATTILIRGSDNACIPADADNIDYQAYLASGVKAAKYVLPVDPSAAQKQALQTHLEALITSFNSKYKGLSLSNSDSLAAASLKLLNIGADWSDCQNIKLLYDTINSI